jgi:glutamate 5-kinase
MSQRLMGAKRIVIKIGSALLIDKDKGQVQLQWLKTLAEDIASLKTRGADVLVVSSGAIALGRRKLKLHNGQLNLEEAQASAAAGQIDLVHAYQNVLQPHGLTIAQVLLTLFDTEERRRYLNARDTMETLLGAGAIPVINENDTVATSEIRFGDNDRLAARVASMISADALILLSDIDGLYREDPRLNPDAEFIPEVREITPDIEAMAGPVSGPSSGSGAGRAVLSIGTGGMETKIIAAKIAVEAGCHMAVTSGVRSHPIKAILDGKRATWFTSSDTPRAARKRWIAGGLKIEGVLTVDAGAHKALLSGKSLLPAGTKSVSGIFDRGATLDIQNENGQSVARGLSAYSSQDATRIIGHNSAEIEGLLGYRGRAELVHRDDMVLK